MKVFLAGATGAVGRRMIPMLLARGHAVMAMTRDAEKLDALRAAGAEPVVADALDRRAVVEAMVRAAPDVVVHQMTDLTGVKSFRRFDHVFARTNLLRTRGTDHLVEGARSSGARRIVAQSYGGWIYEPVGTAHRTEADRLDPEPPRNQRRSLEAIRHLEAAVASAGELDGIVLRYGTFYGPGTAFAPDGDIVALVHRRALPVIGDGGGVWSFVHVDDAAAAAVVAVEGGAPGIYNVVDDDPAPVATWLPELARVIGARPPLRIPVWLGRIAAGEVGVSLMTRIRGLSNAAAKGELGWLPLHPSWREGFRSVLAGGGGHRSS